MSGSSKYIFKHIYCRRITRINLFGLKRFGPKPAQNTPTFTYCRWNHLQCFSQKFHHPRRYQVVPTVGGSAYVTAISSAFHFSMHIKYISTLHTFITYNLYKILSVKKRSIRYIQKTISKILKMLRIKGMATKIIIISKIYIAPCNPDF